VCAIVFPLVHLISLSPTTQQLVIALGFGLSILSTLAVLFGPKIALLLSGADVDNNLSVTSNPSQRPGASGVYSRGRSHRVGPSKISGGAAESDNSSVGSGVSDDFDLFKMASKLRTRYFLRPDEPVRASSSWSSFLRSSNHGGNTNTLIISNHGDSRRVRERSVTPKIECLEYNQPNVDSYETYYTSDMIVRYIGAK